MNKRDYHLPVLLFIFKKSQSFCRTTKLIWAADKQNFIHYNMQQSLNDIWHMADYSQQMHRTVNQKVNRPNKIFPRNLLSVLNEYMHYSTELANSIKQGVAFKGKGWLVMYPKKVFQSLFQSAHVDDHLNIKRKIRKKKKYWLYLFWLHFLAKTWTVFFFLPLTVCPISPHPF